jgi:molecular chaperone DnaK
MAAYNRTLGRFHLVGIPPAPRGVPQIEVTFDIDANGIVNVSAKDLATQKQQAITITGSSNLSKEDIDKMVKESEKFAEEDKKKREVTEIKNRADSLVYTTEKTLREHGDKISSSDKERIEKAIQGVKDALKGEDIDRIKQATEELTQASYKIAEVMYKEAAKPKDEPKEEKKDEGDVVEGEFKET